MDQIDQVPDKGIDLRHHARCAVPPTCLLSFRRFAPSLASQGDPEGEGLVLDLSIGGCSIQSEAAVQLGDALTVILLLAGETSPIMVDLALVRWADGSRFGLEFISMGTAELQQLQRFLVSVEGRG
ncbi:MAG: PilZ domain-containing protein [Nitrospirales bacterium]|nr:PilZ domain-containing protein [Nitrospira sp.]MEB2339571.1 PilZ domain-containing protein [Nitrospirales bacterium]QOJ36516.1 MAG: PilZ domain-containing protein [Nitrospira sp.]